jgi:integrase
MANLGKKNGVYLARFRFLGKEYKKSLKTTDRKAAEGAMHRVEDALHRLAINTLAVPEGVDVGAFIVSGGTRQKPTAKHRTTAVPSVKDAVREYTDNLAHLAVLNRSTIRTHLGNLRKKLGPKTDAPLDRVEPRDLERFLQARLKERSSTTVSKERVTVTQFFDWAVAMNYIATSPAASLTRVKSAGDLPPFRTYKEIEAVVKRGGLTARQVLRLWDSLYLSPVEVGELLSLVRERAVYDVTFVLHAIPAYTGMRRGEILRLRWTDVEFEHDALVARSLKQSRQAVETSRRIDLHPELKKILLEWRECRQTGQYVVCDPGRLEMLSSRQTSGRFYFPLRGTKWCLSSRRDWFKLGFHTYRHSFASNLASAGIDQRMIDEWMGHQTEAMRKRYRHLFPRDRRSAIESFSFVTRAICKEKQA